MAQNISLEVRSANAAMNVLANGMQWSSKMWELYVKNCEAAFVASANCYDLCTKSYGAWIDFMYGCNRMYQDKKKSE